MKITLDHGGGGKKTDELIERIFQPHFNSPELLKRDDGGMFEEKFVLSTDTFVVTPIFFPGGNIGDLAIAGTVNDLASMGAEPEYFSFGFVLEEGLDSGELEKILVTMERLIDELGIEVIAADTKVVEAHRKDNPGLFINSTGIGRIYRPLLGRESIEPGDGVIVTGAVGEHGFAVLSHRLNLSSSITSDTRPLWPMIKKLLDTVPVKFMRDPTRGGLAQVLNEIVSRMPFGIEIHEENVPVRPEVKGLSELLGIDPLEVANEGNMIIIIASEHIGKALNVLKSHPFGTQATLIGEVTSEHPGMVLTVNQYGARRILYRPSGAKLPRIC